MRSASNNPPVQKFLTIQRPPKPNVNILRPTNGRPVSRTNKADLQNLGNKIVGLYSQIDGLANARNANHVELVILIQEILHALAPTTNGRIKYDFLLHKNSAPKLSMVDFDILSCFNQLIRTGHQLETVDKFIYNLGKMDPSRQKAAEHLTKLMEGSNERPVGTVIGNCSYTYKQGSEVLQRIISSGYFNRRLASMANFYRIDVTIGQETTIPKDEITIPTITDSLNLSMDL